jgi:hypothetical protein
MGYQVDAQTEIDAAANALEDNTQDYEALLNKIEEAKQNASPSE